MIATLVQARMNSRRLPGKVMLPIGSQPMIAHVLERSRRAELPELVGLVTGTAAVNEPLVAWALAHDIPCFRGSDDDVLARFVAAAKWFGADVVVRITGDCPLVDPSLIDQVVAMFQSGRFDYASNIHPPTFPDGLDVEVTSLTALENADRAATLPSEREHVTPFIWKRPLRFTLANLANDIDRSASRWIVDDARDLMFVRAVYEELYPGNPAFTTADVLALLESRPELSAINSGTPRNEGYARSLLADRTAQ